MNGEKKECFRIAEKIVKVIENAKEPRVIDGISHGHSDVNEKIIFKILEVILEETRSDKGLKNLKIVEEILEILRFAHGGEYKMVKMAEIVLARNNRY